LAPRSCGAVSSVQKRFGFRQTNARLTCLYTTPLELILSKIPEIYQRRRLRRQKGFGGNAAAAASAFQKARLRRTRRNLTFWKIIKR